jgi:hypothetical protein
MEVLEEDVGGSVAIIRTSASLGLLDPLVLT